jgi:hypothetical protein
MEKLIDSPALSTDYIDQTFSTERKYVKIYKRDHYRTTANFGVRKLSKAEVNDACQ